MSGKRSRTFVCGWRQASSYESPPASLAMSTDCALIATARSAASGLAGGVAQERAGKGHAVKESEEGRRATGRRRRRGARTNTSLMCTYATPPRCRCGRRERCPRLPTASAEPRRGHGSARRRRNWAARGGAAARAGWVRHEARASGRSRTRRHHFRMRSAVGLPSPRSAASAPFAAASASARRRSSAFSSGLRVSLPSSAAATASVVSGILRL